MWSRAIVCHPWSRVSFSEDVMGKAAGWSWGCQENTRRQGKGLWPGSQVGASRANVSLTQKAQESYVGTVPEAACMVTLVQNQDSPRAA